MGRSERRTSLEDEEWHALDTVDDAEKRLLDDHGHSPSRDTSRRPGAKRRRSRSGIFHAAANWCRHRWLRVATPLVLLTLSGAAYGLFQMLKPEERRPPPPLRPSTRFRPQAEWDQRELHTALYDSCAANDWRPGLFTNCTLRMGLNNLRSELAQCMKFAFDAGAGLVLPRIQLRDNNTLSAWAADGPGIQYVESHYYFDIDSLRAEVSRSCPGFVFKEAYDHSNVKYITEDVDRGWWELRFGRGDYRKHFDQLLSEANITTWSENEAAVVVEHLLPYAVWNYQTDPVGVANTFFDMIHWAPRLQALGDAISYHPALREPYAGVHLRVERDVISFWASFEAQSDAYEPWIRSLNVSTIYLACGDATFEEKFQKRFSDFKVVGKWELLSTMPERYSAAAAQLGFDELAVLDYVPMLHAAQVYGIGVSSFAYLLGVDRRPRYASHYADWLHQEIMPEGATLVGDERTLLLPPILPEYYAFFP